MARRTSWGRVPAASLFIAGVGAVAIGEAATQAEPISARQLAAADVMHGQQIALVCQPCHSFKKGGPPMMGPNLWGIVGAGHAHQPGFGYSQAFVALKGEPWDYEALNLFLFSPSAAIPGTLMTFYGLKKLQDRTDLIAWMRLQSDHVPPLPGTAHKRDLAPPPGIR